MKTIYKYPFPLLDEVELKMPQGARVLKVGVQPTELPNSDKALAVWAMVDTDAQTETRQFRIYGTGHPIEHDDIGQKYVDTVFMSRTIVPGLESTVFVWHVFEVLTWGVLIHDQ